DALVRHAKTRRSLVLVGLLLGDELLCDLLRPNHPVELERHLAVPVETEPAERLLDLVGRLRHLAARVRVLDPEQKLAALMAREPGARQTTTRPTSSGSRSAEPRPGSAASSATPSTSSTWRARTTRSTESRSLRSRTPWTSRARSRLTASSSTSARTRGRASRLG